MMRVTEEAFQPPLPIQLVRNRWPSSGSALVKVPVDQTLAKVLYMEMSAGAEQGYLLASEAGPAQKKPLLAYTACLAVPT